MSDGENDVTRLWLTYAWKDNKDEDVDHIIGCMRSAGLDVRFDRSQLLAGQRLWEQIDANIREKEIDAWLIYATENSLRSEPCREELAYALDRALTQKGPKFPLIGLFPGHFDPDLLPAALATRLCVNLHDNEWVDRIRSALQEQSSFNPNAPLPYGFQLHKRDGFDILEVWPRTGTWTPFLAVVRAEDAELLKGIQSGPRGHVDGMSMVCGGEGFQLDMFGRMMTNPVTSATSGQIALSAPPRWIEFGQMGGPLYRIDFTKIS